MTETKALSKVGTIRAMLEKSKGELGKALPQMMGIERFVRISMTAVQRNPSLLDCTPQSLIGACMQAAQLGLEPDPVLGLAYLVPFKNQGTLEVTLIPGYKGLIQLAYRSERVSAIRANVVRKDDHFEWHEGTDAKIVHRPKLLEKVPEDQWHEVVALYCIALMRDGATRAHVMSMAEVKAVRDRSPQWRKSKSGPWATDSLAMALKTPTRRLMKWIPLSVEAQRAVALDEIAESGISQGLSDLAPSNVIDAEAQELDIAPAGSALDKLADSIPDDNKPKGRRAKKAGPPAEKAAPAKTPPAKPGADPAADDDGFELAVQEGRTSG